MSEINIPLSEQVALRAIDSSTLSSLIDQCLGNGHASALAHCTFIVVGSLLAPSSEASNGHYWTSVSPKHQGSSRLLGLTRFAQVLTCCMP